MKNTFDKTGMRRFAETVRKVSGGQYNAQESFLLECKTIPQTGGTVSFTLSPEEVKLSIERRLNKSDLFRVEGIAFALAQLSTTTGVDLHNVVPQFYPNVAAIPNISGSLVTADLEAVYNGTMSREVGDRKNIEALPMRVFRHVPTSQQTDSTNQSEYDFAEVLHQPISPILLNGGATIKIEVKIPSWTAAKMSPTTGATIQLIFFAYGSLVKDGIKMVENKTQWESLKAA